MELQWNPEDMNLNGKAHEEERVIIVRALLLAMFSV